MPRSPERPSMDLLKMSRQEVAAIPLLGRPDLPEARIYATAKIIDQAIQAQFPESKESARLPLATDLARQLDSPHPQIAASRLRLFYEQRRQGKTAGSTDDDGAEGPLISQGSGRVHRER